MMPPVLHEGAERGKRQDLGVSASSKSAQCAPCYSGVSQLRDVCLKFVL